MEPTELLIKNLRHKYWKTRANAARELGEMGNPAAVFPLIEALRDEERVVQESAVEALGKIGSPAVMPLTNILSDENNWKIRSEVVNALVKIGKPAVRPLVKLLRNSDRILFTFVVNILGKIGDPEAVLPLLNALEEWDSVERLDVIRALVKIGDKRAVKPIIDHLEKNWSYYNYIYGSSLGMVGTLVQLGEPAAMPLLLDMLRGKDCWVAAELLGKFGKVAVKPLTALLKDKEINKQGLIAAALGYTGAEEAVNPLLTALKDENRIVSWRASTALLEIGEAAVEPLIQMLNDKNNYIRMLAVDSLGRIGDKRAVEPLEKLIENEGNEEIRKSAMKALERLQPEKAPPFTGKKIDIDKDVYVLNIGLTDRYFTASLDDDILYLSGSDMRNLPLGELLAPISVPYRYTRGRTVPEDFIYVGVSSFLISDRIKKLFTDNNFTGWKTYPISLYDKSGNLIEGYHGFAVTGRVGPIDFSRSEIVAKPPIVVGRPDIVKVGIYFDENSWDGSDFFLTMGVSATSRVVEALRKARPKVKNWEATPASKEEWSIILFEQELTEKERDKVNELRMAFKEEHLQDLQRTAEILAQGEIGDNQDFLYLLKSVIQNQCMFTANNDQSICQGILKSLGETGQTGIIQMVDALQNKDGEIRAGAAWALGKHKVKKAVNWLLQAIKDEDEHVRREAVMALGEIRDFRTVIPLVKIMEGEDTLYVRCGAAGALGTISDPRAIQPLISVLKNEGEESMLCEAALALGKFGAPQAVLPLIELFENEDSNLAEHIKWALADIGKPAVIPLIQALKHSQALVRGRAAGTLGHMGEQKAVLPLINRLTVEEDLEVLIFIVEVLGQLGDRRAVKPLLNIAKTATVEYLQEEARIALQKILGTK